MKYRPDIDGLRAVAILPVVLYHTGFSLFSGGFVGVDIFFVISGYLITFIIHEDIKAGRFTISGFYERRIRRIFPALFTVILFCFVTAASILLPQAFESFAQSVVAATLFVANIYFLTESDYFAAAADSRPLLHTWSLSVEEQFYLFFPLLLVFIYKYFQGNWRPFLLPAALVSLALSIFGISFFPSATFYLLPARGWELLLGSFLALGVFPQPRRKRAREAASSIGLALIAWSIFFFTSQTPFPGWHALLPCTGAALIIYAGRDGTSAVGRVLSHPVIVFVGLISYSLYLWHWPLMVFARQLSYGRLDSVHGAAVVCLSIVLAILSWRYVERPFRKKGTARQRKKLFTVAAGVMVLTVGAGYGVDFSQGWPGRFGGKLIALQCDLSRYNLGSCFLKEDQRYTQWQGQHCFLQTGKAQNTLLWGDSFAAHYVPGIMESLHLIDFNILQYNAGGCAPAFAYDPAYRPQCKAFSAQVDTIIEKYNISTVIMAAAWKMALDNGLRYEDIASTVARLRSRGIRVVMIGQSPRFDQSVQDISNRANILGESLSETRVSVDYAAINSRLREITGTDSFVDPSAVFCTGQKCRFKGSDGFYFWDDGHYTTLGSRLVSQFIFTEFNIPPFDSVH